MRQPPGRPPTPTSVSRAQPGGDAHDPHLAALNRQLELGWARRRDKGRQVEVPLPDARHWKRVRYRGIEHFTGFRYGNRHHVIAIVFVVDMPPETRVDSQHCMRRFETLARPHLRQWEVRLDPIGSTGTTWHRDGSKLVVRFVDGEVKTLVSLRQFAAAWVAYPAYPDACLIYGVGVQARGHLEEARQVRDRFIREGFAELVVRTETRPVPH